MTRILLIGGAGQLGQELQQTLAPLGTIISASRRSVDLTQFELLREYIHSVKPNIICNAAAYTAVDKAETESELAYAINAIAPQIMAESAAEIGATIVHVSTDYVFDGSKNTPYIETDATHPLNVYGQSKLEGELRIRKYDRHWIVRTSWVYGAFGKTNFVKTMLRLGAEREEIRVVNDQIGTPTAAGSIATVIYHLLAQSETEFGTYHFSDRGVASWYDFAVAIFEEARSLNIPLAVQRTVPIATSEYPTPAKRPTYSVLSSQKLLTQINWTPNHWRQQLRQMLKQFNQIA